MTPWDEAEIEWAPPKFGLWAMLRGVVRVTLIVLWTIFMSLATIILRLVGLIMRNPNLVLIAFRVWAAGFLLILGFRVTVHGRRPARGGAVVANHVSWIDIPLFTALSGGYFVAKSEIGNWPVVGQLGRLLRTEFIKRDPKYTKQVVDRLKIRFNRGERIIFYPEATTTDGLHLIPFRSSLFDPLADPELDARIYPMLAFYHAPKGASRNFFGTWGHQSIAEHFWAVMRLPHGQRIDVYFEDRVEGIHDRRALRDEAERRIRARFDKVLAEQSAQLVQESI